MESSGSTLVNNHRQDGWLAVSILIIVIETLFFALRVYCRWVSRVGWGADDHLVAVGYVSCIAVNSLGIGQHTQQVIAVDADDVVLFLKLQMPLSLMYICAAITAKMAIIAFFLRVFIQKPFRIACWVIQTLLTIYLIAGLASILCACRPFSANWQTPDNLGKVEYCFDITSQYRASSIANIVIGAFIFLLPIPVVWRAEKSRPEKIGLLVAFCLGLAGIIFSIIRLVAILSLFSLSDFLWTASYPGIFTTLEPASYFLVACVVGFHPLLKLLSCGGRSKSQGISYGSESRRVSLDRDTINALGRRWLGSLSRLSSVPSPTITSKGSFGNLKSKTSWPRFDSFGADTIRDEEWELNANGRERGMDIYSVAEELSRAHNKPTFTGQVTISTVAADARAARGEASRDRRSSGSTLSFGRSPEVRNAMAIAVKHEIDITRS